MWRIALCMICVTLGTFAADIDEELYYSLLKYGVVPEVIPFCPMTRFPVVFPSGAEVNLGNEISPSETLEKPFINYQTNYNRFYTLAFIDGGVSSRVSHATKLYRLWLVINIPGSNVGKGEEVSPFVQPLAIEKSKNTGPPVMHRYVFLVYEQMRKIYEPEMEQIRSTLGDRSGFSVADFLFQYNMTIPLYGNFYLGKYMDPSQEKKVIRQREMYETPDWSNTHQNPNSDERFPQKLPVQQLSSASSNSEQPSSKNQSSEQSSAEKKKKSEDPDSQASSDDEESSLERLSSNEPDYESLNSIGSSSSDSSSSDSSSEGSSSSDSSSEESEFDSPVTTPSNFLTKSDEIESKKNSNNNEVPSSEEKSSKKQESKNTISLS